jgi:hypothetical protein
MYELEANNSRDARNIGDTSSKTDNDNISKNNNISRYARNNRVHDNSWGLSIAKGGDNSGHSRVNSNSRGNRNILGSNINIFFNKDASSRRDISNAALQATLPIRKFMKNFKKQE